MTAFMKQASAMTGLEFENYRALHKWSIADRESFWSLVWDFCGVIGEKGERILVDGDKMPGASFFPDARINYAENLLRKTGAGDAIVFRGEDKVCVRWSWDDLHAATSRIRQYLQSLGVKQGDRVAAMMPNMPETVAAMLAAVSLGAVWSSCSPDFGVKGVLDRFGQIEPVILIAPDAYWYGGKQIDVSEKLKDIAAGLPSLRAVLVVDYLGKAQQSAAGIPAAIALADAIGPFEPAVVNFLRLPFSHPVSILFSSGTTGVPKCIVHSAGGTLLQHVKEQRLHTGVLPGERFFWFTTCGWMMWNWLVSNLASEATIMLYDGSPLHLDGNIIFDYVQSEKITYFGTSPKFIDFVNKSGMKPIETHDLSSVKMILSTGSPLSPESYRFVYSGIKHDVHLSSGSGGTDIVASFISGIPDEPVWAGEIQGPALGMAVDVWDDDGNPIVGQKGELVCTKAFPSMPVMFWNDPDGAKYHAAYFEHFDNVWRHGDFAEWTVNGGMVIYGRSDATLNPGGVRIGTSEIYNVVEQLPEIIEALCIGQIFDHDTRIVLFVVLQDGNVLDDALKTKIRDAIRRGASPRHVPARIVAVAAIPRTKSGKITEIAVRDIVHGVKVKNIEALANPEALKLYEDIPDLKI